MTKIIPKRAVRVDVTEVIIHRQYGVVVVIHSGITILFVIFAFISLCMFVSFPILLVDDDAAIADILKRVAERVFPEATIAHARNYSEAAAFLANVDKEVFRLVLLDIDLKTDSTGFDFLSLLREQPFGQLVPVIVLSASLEETKAREPYLRGANAFTNKPFTYAAWKTYVEQLRSYWYETVTIPQIRFRQGPDSFLPLSY